MASQYRRIMQPQPLAGDAKQPLHEAWDAGAYRVIEVLFDVLTAGTAGTLRLHCSQAGCCFELAALRWRCRVQGVFGLPNSFILKDNDFRTTAVPWTGSSSKCSADGKQYGWNYSTTSSPTNLREHDDGDWYVALEWICDVGEPGVPWQDATFCGATNCLRSNRYDEVCGESSDSSSGRERPSAPEDLPVGSKLLAVGGAGGTRAVEDIETEAFFTGGILDEEDPLP